MAGTSTGAIIASFQKRFSRRQILFLLYAPLMFDVLTKPRKSPPRRVPEQRFHGRLHRRATSARQR
jgi:hypothetical protein